MAIIGLTVFIDGDIYIYIYIYVGVCVCVCAFSLFSFTVGLFCKKETRFLMFHGRFSYLCIFTVDDCGVVCVVFVCNCVLKFVKIIYVNIHYV